MYIAFVFDNLVSCGTGRQSTPTRVKSLSALFLSLRYMSTGRYRSSDQRPQPRVATQRPFLLVVIRGRSIWRPLFVIENGDWYLNGIETMLWESAKYLTDIASSPYGRYQFSGERVRSIQAKSELSSEAFMISSCSRIKTFVPPSPYSKGIFTSNRPIRQYAISSGRVVLRCEAQNIFSAMAIRCNGAE